MKIISQDEATKLFEKYYDAFMKREEADWTEDELDEFIFLCTKDSDGYSLKQPIFIYIDNTSGEVFTEEEKEKFNENNLATEFGKSFIGVAMKASYEFKQLKKEIVKYFKFYGQSQE